MAWMLAVPLLCGCAAEPTATAPTPAEYALVRTLPHDPGAFTQGLLFRNGVLLESTGLYGKSSLREVNPETGAVLRKRNLPRDLFGEGLALWSNRLFQLTWREGVLLVYDADTLETLGSLAYEGEGWGLVAWSNRLLRTDGSARLYEHDPATFAVLDIRAVTDGGHPVDRLNELEMVEGELFANRLGDTRVARIDPATGVVRGWIDLAPLVPEALRGSREFVLNGIAYDPETKRLFVTGKNWPVLHVLRLENAE